MVMMVMMMVWHAPRRYDHPSGLHVRRVAAAAATTTTATTTAHGGLWS
jgi:hypothetical protein